jgi:hypothetical protein
MPIADKDIKWVEEPKIGLLEKLYLPAIFEGLQTTVKHMVGVLTGHEITVQYPEERPDQPHKGWAELPPNFRGVPRPPARLTASTSSPPPRPGRTARSTRRRSSLTSCAVSTAECASRLAPAMPSS